MMMHEFELEEGEAFCKDDTTVNPDIALSYIEEKVQSLLGHHQKDFEGGMSAENLGPKYGGYGSFLPMQRWSPSILLPQPKSPKKVQTPHLPRSPNHISPEGHARNADVVSDAPTQQNDSPSPSISVPQNMRSSLDNASVRLKQKAILFSDKVTEALPGKDKLPISNSCNPSDQKTLKVRIKVGTDRVAQYNAEIYNLGLTSPSSSEGDSQDESDDLMLDSHEIPNESTEILQIMTSPLVGGGLLLSPLNEDLINLHRETECLVESAHKPAANGFGISAKSSHGGVLAGKEKEVIERKKAMKSNNGFAMNLNENKLKTFGGDDLEHLHPFLDSPGIVRESEKDVRLKNRKGNKDKVKGRAVSGDLVKETSLEHASDHSCAKSEMPELRYGSMDKVWKHGAKSCKDGSVDFGQCSRTPGNRNRASSIALSDNSEGEWVRGTTNGSSLKVGLNSTSHKSNGLGKPRLSLDGKNKLKGSQTSGKSALKAESLRNDDCDIPQNNCSGKKDGHNLQFSQKDTVQKRLNHMDNPKNSVEKPSSSSRPKNSSLGSAKAKATSGNHMKARSSSEKYVDKATTAVQPVDPPVAAIDATGVEPVIIEDNWVGCDVCQKWRLLPYGVQSNQLPDKWVCSMLDWLPGMNSCEISEDETTKAVQDLYLVPVPVPNNQPDFQTHVDGALTGVISAGVHSFNQNAPVYDQLKKPKLKEKQNATSAGDPGHSKAKKHLQQMAMKDELQKKVKQSLDGVNTTNKSDMLQHPNKNVSKSNKRKSEHVFEDGVNPRKKIKETPAQQTEGKVNKIKSKQSAMENIAHNGQDLLSDLPKKIAKKDGMNRTTQKDGRSAGVSDFESYGKKEKDQMQHLPGNAPIDSKPFNCSEVSTERIKLKDSLDNNQRQGEVWQNNGNLQDGKASIKEDSNGSYLHKSKKARVCKVEDGFKVNQGDDISKRKSSEPRICLSGSKEGPINMDVGKEERMNEQRRKKRLSVEDLDKLKKDLGWEQVSTTATSSSSKVSDSRKNRNGYMGVRVSPQESVSSSPVRIQYMNEAVHIDKVGKADSRTNNVSTEANSKKFTSTDDNYNASKREVSSNKRHAFSEGSSIKSAKHDTNGGKKELGKSSDIKKKNQSAKREHDKNDTHPCRASVTQENLTEVFPRSSTDQTSRKLWVNSSQGDNQGVLGPSKHGSRASRPSKSSIGASLVDQTSKASKETATQNGTGNCGNNEAEQSMVLDANHGNKNTGNMCTALKEAEDAWKEAEKLRTHADLIKNTGFSSESNYEYFKAALKFLHGASLLETCNGESIKHPVMSPIQMYGNAAKIFRNCASEYEKGCEMAAATLAYKCVEIAYMRVVYCKSSTTNRVWRDLQSNLLTLPQGDSPSSSASDVDNLNNLAAAEKGSLAKIGGSQTGNHIIPARNRPNVVRLLDFTKDVNSAMEAAKKLQETLSAAMVEVEESQNTEAIIALKRVVEFSFQNVKELVGMVLNAFNIINQGNRG
ncbi:cysteine-tryptophan domain-containing zinc finger protein 3-like isoform X2 [Andrographis paniculata]|uniref:cysteine-tryptophan domain-containing zinc finger protein 3-like isoform X2 n=1 Tax=Andrographis paniculata TaxID=175694 RepID=UPI0021E75ABA|nr:cysteine-tryptophan domain-containing zinc finger protein 3-like isoform X2 [Andrographis paniculata]